MNIEEITQIPTFWGQLIQSVSYLGTRMNLPSNITLNEKLGINTDAQITENDKFMARYFCIGIGAHGWERINDKISIDTVTPHRPTDAAPFDMMPFVLRRLNNDLTQTERQRYRLYRKITINGEQYHAYYLRTLKVNDTVQVIETTTSNGTVTERPYVTNESNLSPKKPSLSPNSANLSSNVKIGLRIEAEIAFDSFDVQEYLEVCRILLGSSRYAVISEIGLTSAVDKYNPASQTSEVAKAVVTNFISTYINVHRGRLGFSFPLDVGDKIPLLVESPVVTTVGG